VAANTAIAKLRANMPSRLFDLPTEAQWEYACRAGTVTDLYMGYYEGTTSYFQTSLGKLAWYGGNSGGSKHIGGLKRPNAFGLYDMLGNMVEHCRDLIPGTGTGDAEEPHTLSGTLTEPYGMSEGTAASWNINERGGYYGRAEQYCTAEMRRLNHKLGSGQAYMGFRLWLLDE
jgi:formylglycine-generating enzyme required for sulfatase activity